MNSIERWAFDPIRNAVSALRRGAGGTLAIDMGLVGAAYSGVNPEVGGATPFQLTKDHSRVQILNPAGAIVVKLPTTGIKAGDRIRIVNRSTTTANTVTVQSSGANQVGAILYTGFIEVTAVTNAPTAAADWFVSSYYSEGAFTAAVTFATGAASSVTQVSRFNRTGNLVRFQTQISFLLNTGSGAFSIGSLPFASSSISAQNQVAIPLFFHTGFSLPAGRNLAVGVILNSTTTMTTAMQSTTGTASTPITSSELGASMEFYASGTYQGA